MKKLLTFLALIAFASTVTAATTTSKFQTDINNRLNALNKKEQALTDKVNAKKTEAANKKKEAIARQEANKKALEKKRAENVKAVEQTKKNLKDTVDAQKNYWNSLKSVK